MAKNFSVNVNQNLNFEISPNNLKGIDLIQEGEDIYHIIEKNKSLRLKVIHADFYNKEYTISLNSKIYHLKISDSLDLMINKMGYSFNSTKKLTKKIVEF